MLRVLYVTSNLNNGYQSPIYYGLRAYANSHEMQLFTYALSTTNPGTKVQKYLLQQLSQMPKVDVLIVNSATFEFIDSHIDLRVLKQEYSCKKLIVVGRNDNDLCSITIDNQSGIFQCVDHLVQKHHTRRVGFIGGPINVNDAQERQNAFMAAVDRHNLHCDPDWLFNGEFTFDSGYQAVQRLDPNNLPEALICADDYIAFGAQKAIADLEYNIQLTGFDNVEQAQYCDPPLTTVHQPLYEMGRKAGEQAFLPDNADNIIVDCELIVRSSCTCIGALTAGKSLPIIQPKDDILTTLTTTLRSRLALHKDSVTHLGEIIALYTNLPADITISELLSNWQACVFAGSPNYYALSECNSLLTQHCLELQDNLSTQNRLLEVSSQLDTVIHGLINEQYNELLNDRSDQFSGVLGLTRDLDTTSDQLQLIHSIENAFETLGINHYCLSLTDKRRGLFFDLHNLESTMQIASTTEPKATPEYLLQQAVPDWDIWSDQFHNLIVLPLVLDRFYFGQLIMATKDHSSDILEHVRHNLSVALLSHTNMEQSRFIRQELESTLVAIEDRNKTLLNQTQHDELTGLINRRGFLQLAPERLAQGNQTLYFGDMDGLKTINDRYGHDVGDQAICFIADALSSTFADDALCARIGGDEFVILSSIAIADINEQLDSWLATQIERYTLTYSLSISLGKASSNEAEDINQLMAIADERLYQQKLARREHDSTASSADH